MTSTDLDACLELVANRRRRSVIDHVRSHSAEPTTRDDLVDSLVRAEPDPTIDLSRDREQLALLLHHTHLPKLDEHGVIEYDPDTGTVRYRQSELLESVLDSLPEETALATS